MKSLNSDDDEKMEIKFKNKISGNDCSYAIKFKLLKINDRILKIDDEILE